ncbi:MAG TPA: hypothetical protein VFC03_11400 [Acidimicrobiales bacterium]|nr:hypothetical protein [Acidimicrobiales bacterium]
MVAPVEPAEPVVTDGAAVAPVVALVLVAPPEPLGVVVDDPLDAPVDDEAGHPSAWSDARVDCAVCKLV